MRTIELVVNLLVITGMAIGVWVSPPELRGLALVLACGIWWMKKPT